MIRTEKQLYDYYNQPKVQFKLIKYTQKKEFAMLSKKELILSSRNHKVHNIQQFQKVYFGLKAWDNLQNLYISLATYQKGINWIGTYFNHERKDKTRKWAKVHYKEMVGYDFVIDVDSPDHDNIQIAADDCSNIMKLFNELNVPYRVRFSGCGFHVLIDSKHFPTLNTDPKQKNSVYKLHIEMANYLYENYSELIDLSIYDSRRVIKLPFSVAVYGNGSYIVLPINHINQLIPFDLNFFNLNTLYAARIQDFADVEHNPKGNIDRLLKTMKIDINKYYKENAE